MDKVDCMYYDECDTKGQCPECSCNVAAGKAKEMIKKMKQGKQSLFHKVKQAITR
jgi:ferredoxin